MRPSGAVGEGIGVAGGLAPEVMVVAVQEHLGTRPAALRLDPLEVRPSRAAISAQLRPVSPSPGARLTWTSSTLRNMRITVAGPPNAS